jgi:hypothetical protein
MAKQSLEYSLSSLNNSLDSYDLLNEQLDRAYALVRVALSDEFAKCEQLVIYSYLSLLADLILNMRRILESFGNT